MIEDRSYGKAELCHALLSHRYPQGSAQPAGEMDQPVSRAQAEPLFRAMSASFPTSTPGNK